MPRVLESWNEMNDIQKRILVAIINIQQRHKQDFINDSQLADELSLNSQIVQDHLVLMAEEGYVNRTTTLGGCLVSPTPKGRITLQEPDQTRTSRKAVILTALPVEYKAVCAHLTSLQEETHPQGTVYEKGKKDLLDNWALTRFGSESWQNYVLEYRVKLIDFDTDSSNSGLAYVRFRNNSEVSYQVALSPYYSSFGVFHDPDGPWQFIDGVDLAIERDRWYEVRVEVIGPQIKVWLDGLLRVITQDTRLDSGGFALGVGPDTIAHFDDIRIIEILE
jgi:DNA-binding MarR family transcriptional regulator